MSRRREGGRRGREGGGGGGGGRREEEFFCFSPPLVRGVFFLFSLGVPLPPSCAVSFHVDGVDIEERVFRQAKKKSQIDFFKLHLSQLTSILTRQRSSPLSSSEITAA